VKLRAEFTPDSSKEGGGTLKLFVNEQPAGEGKLKRSTFRHGLEPFEVGGDSITPVSPHYKSPFAFTGTIEKITFELTEK
jgi:arylsulfatase